MSGILIALLHFEVECRKITSLINSERRVMSDQGRLISHQKSTDDFASIVHQYNDRIIGDCSLTSKEKDTRLDEVKKLSEFEFGRFLLTHRGINGFWTHYMLTHPWYGRQTGLDHRGQPLSSGELFLLDRAPTILATQQRFEIFLKHNQLSVHEGACLACIPCGMMGELLYLDFKNINHIELIGIDYDQSTFDDAKQLASSRDLTTWMRLEKADAWALSHDNAFDLISSNGLNIYEPNDDQVTALYRQFYQALKPQGRLVTSFLTPPPTVTSECEWLMDLINPDDLARQKIIFSDVLDTKWQCFRSSEQTMQQLKTAGFNHIEIEYDLAHLFPTVVAVKD